MQQGQQEPLLQPLCRLLPLIVFFLVAPFPSLSQTYSSDCAPIPYSCGDVSFTLSYPFRLHSQPDYCGHPAFILNCTNNNSTLILPINRYIYKVKSLDTLNRLLTIVNTDFVDQSCPAAYQNTTLDSSLYEYDEYNRNLTLYFNCTAQSTIPDYYQVGCLLGVKGTHSYYRFDNGSFSELLGRCSSTAVIPMTLVAASQFENGNLSLGAALQEGFGVRWTVGSDWCGGCVSSGGLCGFNRSAPSAHTCVCANASYIDTCNQGAIFKDKMIIGGIFKNKKLIIGLTIGIGVFLFLCLLFFLYFRWHKRMCSTNIFGKKNSFGAQTIEAAIGKYESLAPKRYKYSDVKKITKSFHDKIGQGGYGIVFKGSLKDGRLVAVKVLNDSKENGAEFINEVSSIGWTSHVNVVSLLGFCFEGSKRALIYEFMQNGSLEKYIYSEKEKSTLGWENLYRIAIGIARGLEYLHHQCNTRMVHFDIKPQNILLDNEFCPKISDFGLAKLCPPKDSKLSMPVPRGTIGYIAPEVFSRNFGVASSKSDVYSYGMVVLDMVGTRNNKNTRVENTSETYFPDWIYSHLEQDGDLEAWGVTNETQEIAKKLIIVGLWCIQMLPRNRPSMSMVIEMLEGSISDLKVPPKEYLSSTLESLFGTSSTWVSEDASGCM